jgi:tetratricopeptide (TPR) repeat protein
MKLHRGILSGLGLALTLSGASPVFAQEAEATQAQPEPTAAATASGEALSPEEEKRRAVERRIAEYLEAKERRRLEAETRAAQAAETETAATAAPATAAAAPAPSKRPALPRELALAQQIVRQSHLGKDPTIHYYLDLIDRSQASPEQLAAFGNFLADSGMNRMALPYYEVAVRLRSDDPVLWNNIGTIYRQLGDWDDAKQAYARSLSLNPTNAMAHYNLGAVYDVQRKYDDALREYRIALTIDPELGNPEINPSAANNERLLAVQLMIYQDHAGNVGLPLMPMGEPIVLAPLASELDE